MMKNESSIVRLRLIHEFLLCLNVGWACFSIFPFSWSMILIRPFLRPEIVLYRVFHIRRTDLITNYFSFPAAAIVLSVSLWLLLHLFFRSGRGTWLLRSVAGIAVLLLPAVFWTYIYQMNGWPYLWPFRGAPFELTVATVCAVLYSKGYVRPPLGALAPLIMAHFFYLYRITSGVAPTVNYGGVVAPILGTCSVLMWVLYVKKMPPAAKMNGSVALQPAQIQ